MSALHRRLRRLEAEQRADWLERVATIFGERTGRSTTAADVAQLLADVEAKVAPYLASGLEPVAAYAQAGEVDAGELRREAEWWAEAVLS